MNRQEYYPNDIPEQIRWLQNFRGKLAAYCNQLGIPAGNYVVRLCIEWQGAVLGADRRPHDVMVQVLALRRS